MAGGLGRGSTASRFSVVPVGCSGCSAEGLYPNSAESEDETLLMFRLPISYAICYVKCCATRGLTEKKDVADAACRCLGRSIGRRLNLRPPPTVGFGAACAFADPGSVRLCRGSARLGYAARTGQRVDRSLPKVPCRS